MKTFNQLAHRLFAGEKSEKRLKITLIVLAWAFFCNMILQLIF